MIRPKKSKVPPPPADCPLEDCLKFLSGEWTHKILWYLREDPRRFGDLRRDLGGVSAKVLTTRLRELEQKGVVLRNVMPSSPPTVEYSITPFGRKFEPILMAIADVGEELRKRSTQNLQKKFAAV